MEIECLRLSKLPNGLVKYGPVTCHGKGGVKREKHQEWEKCAELGKRIGIPEGGWFKRHSSEGWAWISQKKPHTFSR